ncbi:hypothetical protein [Helicobacter sp. T3_23-1056]
MDCKKMLETISVGYKFLNEFATFWELGKLTRLGTLGFKLKQQAEIFTNELESKQKRVDSAFEALDLILAYKKQNPKEFEEIFCALERFSQKRKGDTSIDKSIKSLF